MPEQLTDYAAGIPADADAQETREWLESLDYVLSHAGPERVCQLLEQLQNHARRQGVGIPFAS
ncbi:MAG: hypothetical protein WDA75_25475, partial [Candidatus Latescibacterota bacterium]